MTWNQFKSEVDKQLKEQGISGDEPLWGIDTDGDCLDGGVVSVVSYHKTQGIFIS